MRKSRKFYGLMVNEEKKTTDQLTSHVKYKAGQTLLINGELVKVIAVRPRN